MAFRELGLIENTLPRTIHILDLKFTASGIYSIIVALDDMLKRPSGAVRENLESLLNVKPKIDAGHIF
jgi:hypothetical protein